MESTFPVCRFFTEQENADCTTCYCCRYYETCPRPSHEIYKAPERE